MIETQKRTNLVTPASLEGQTLGKYRVLEPLGRGGMAQVYRAYHPQLDRYLAVKVLRSDLVDEKEFLARFQREARSVAGLRHPNIVQIYDFDTQNDLYYMVMELLEGDTLKARLNTYRTRGERMPLGELVKILSDALDGLGYAHSEGIIHRDIKPANLMLTRRGQAVITDFGIAQIVGGTAYTVSGALMGTLNYMAPEQGLENRCDARSDLYSMGIVFYEMLTGKPPFDADTPLAILMKHLNDPLPLPRQVNPDIPISFERVALKVLAKNPDDRYQSAAEMAQALQQAAAEAGVGVAASLSFDLPETAHGSVAVISGTARQSITDAGFAADDTDAQLASRLTAAPVSSPAQPANIDEAAKAFATALRIRLETGIQSGLTSATAVISGIPLPVAVEDETAEEDIKPTGILKAVWGMVGAFLAVNLAAATFGAMTHYWAIYTIGWPIELFLLGLGLSLLMSALALIWMFIPVGILIGNGFILAFYAITNQWQLWGYLWPFEPLLILVVVGVTLWLARRPGGSRRLARRLGVLLAALAGFSVFIVGAAANIVGLFR